METVESKYQKMINNYPCYNQLILQDNSKIKTYWAVNRGKMKKKKH